MTNKLAIVLIVLIVAGVSLDFYFYGENHLVFLGKKFFDLVEWLAFWR